MSDKVEKEILRLTKENNMILRAILKYLQSKSEAKDFVLNVIANLISNNGQY